MPATPPPAEGAGAAILAMSRFERQSQIVDIAMTAGRVDVGDLAELFGVTTETIRRDLAGLQDKHLLRRVHGGAVPWQRGRYEPDLTVRGAVHVEEKYRLARRAVEELQDEDSVLIDSGSTLALIASLLPQDRKLTVVTNSIPVLQVLASNPAVTVVVLGGVLKKNTLAIVDPTGVQELASIVVDVALMGADGISAARGFTTPDRDEVEIKRAMLGAARRAIMLVDGSKFGNDYLHRIATIDEVDAVITNAEAPEADVAAVRAKGPMVILA